MANFFTKFIDKVTPWDRGGEQQRRREEEERRRWEQQQRQQASAPRQSNGPTVQNNFQNTDLGKLTEYSKFGTLQGPVNNVKVPQGPQVQDYSVQTVDEAPKPKQSIWNKVRDQFDANTEADQYRRAMGNKTKGENKPIVLQNPGNIISRTPVVGTVLKGGNTLVNQGRELVETSRGLVAARTNNADAARASFERQDELRRNYQKNKGGIFNVGTLYDEAGAASGDIKTGLRDIAAPTAVAGLDLYTLGQGNIISEGIKQGGRVGLREVAPNILRASAGNYASGDIDARSQGATNEEAIKSGLLNTIFGLAPDIGLPALARNFRSSVLPAISRGRFPAPTDVADELDDAAISASADAAYEALRPRPVTVAQNIPVEGGDIMPQPVRVRNMNEPGNLIREVEGDATLSTPDSLARIRAEQARVNEAAAINGAARPDPRLQGVTPGTDPRFRMDSVSVKKSQDSLADEYAASLKSYDEGVRGGDAIPNGEGGYIRTSEHSDFYRKYYAEKGYAPSKAVWKKYAAEQLEAGKADAAFQKSFDELANPETQSLLAQGEQVNLPEGIPIKVKEVDSINVRENIDVPQNLPETPGKVRVSTKSEPMNVKSERIAATTPVAQVDEAVGAVDEAATPPKTQADTLGKAIDRTGESTEQFLRRTAEPIQDNITRASRALRDTKKVRKGEKGGRVSQAIAAKQKILDEGGSHQEASKAYWREMGGEYSKPEYKGSEIAKEDANRLYSMVDEHYGPEMSMTAENTKRSFDKLFTSGSKEGGGDHIIPSDVKNIRRFLNQMVPEGNLGDAAESAIKELDNVSDGVSRVDKAIALQRAIRFTADASATLRQALPEGLANPLSFGKAVKESFANMFNKGRYEKLIKQLESDKETQYIQDRLKIGMSMLETGSKKGDDIYRNEEWVQKIPGVRAVVSASERQYNTMLTMLRYDIAKRFIKDSGGIASLEKAAVDSGDPDVFLRAFGEAVNTGTGRGGKAGGLVDKNPDFLSRVFISPRNLAAKLNRLNPAWYNRLWKQNPAAAKEAIRTSLVQAAVTASALTAAAQSGNFEDGKIRVGNTRYDVTGGLVTIANTLKDVGEYMTGAKDATYVNNAPNEIISFFQNQMSPIVQTTMSFLGNKIDKDGQYVDKFGEKLTWGDAFLQNFAPIGAENLIQETQDGVPGKQRAVNATLNTLGIGVNTYKSGDDKKADKEQEIRDKRASLSKYLPEGTDELTEDVIKGAVDDAYWAGDWEAYAEGAQAKLDKVNENENSTKEARDKAQQEADRANFIKSKGERFTPDNLSEYEDVGVELWRNMGNPEHEDYDPERYERLWQIDKAMTDGGFSDNTQEGKGSKYPKYNVKTKKGRGGSGGGGRGGKSNLVTNFGTLSSGGSGGPKVREYDTMAMSGGGVPVIKTVRPNIVHKIGTRG